MNRFMTLLVLAVVLPIGAKADITFDDISKKDLENIIQDFGSVFTHTSVSPASSLGEVFGFEVGVVAGLAETPEVEKLVKEVDPSTEVSFLPHAGILGAVSVPMGFKFELVFLPKMDTEDVEVDHKSFAVQWTMTDTVLPLPVDLAVKAHKSMTSMSYSQTVNSVMTDVDLENDVTGLMLLASKKLAIFEPYFGIGMVKADGDMTLSGSQEFFNFTDSQSATADMSGLHIVAGFNVNVLVLRLGFEAGQVFDAKRASAKLSFYF